MGEELLQQIKKMQTELTELAAQGLPMQSGPVLKKSQALDVLIVAYLEQQQRQEDGCQSAAQMLQ